MSEERNPYMLGLTPPTGQLPLDFVAFHRMRRPAYIKYAKTYLGNRADAEEAVDSTFEQLLGKWGQVLASENAHGYAWRVLCNRLSDHRRARDRQPPPMDVVAFDTEALINAADPIEQIAESLTLFRALGMLSQRQRDVMVMRYLHGYSTTEVADELGVTPATVRSTARDAKRRLRTLLGPDRTMEGRTDDVVH